MNVTEIRFYSEKAMAEIPRLCREFEKLQLEYDKLCKYRTAVETMMTQCPKEFAEIFTKSTDRMSKGIPLFGDERSRLKKMFKESEKADV